MSRIEGHQESFYWCILKKKKEQQGLAFSYVPVLPSLRFLVTQGELGMGPILWSQLELKPDVDWLHLHGRCHYCTGVS